MLMVFQTRRDVRGALRCRGLVGNSLISQLPASEPQPLKNIERCRNVSGHMNVDIKLDDVCELRVCPTQPREAALVDRLLRKQTQCCISQLQLVLNRLSLHDPPDQMPRSQIMRLQRKSLQSLHAMRLTLTPLIEPTVHYC